MKHFRYICFALLLFVSFNFVVRAECDDNEIRVLKQISKRITYQYDYVGYSVTDGDFQTYEVYFEGLDDDFYVSIEDNDISYLFEDNGQKNLIQSGKKGFKVSSKKCLKVVDYITIDLPKYNEYSQTSFCVQNKELAVCDEWSKEEITDKQFSKIVKEYSNSSKNSFYDRILNTINKYFYIFIPIAILLIVLVVLFIKKRIMDSRLD